jgi:hypothetical protein
MRYSVQAGLLSLTVAILTSACTGDRSCGPTLPSGPPKLPALDITVDPIAARTDSIPGDSVGSDRFAYEYVITITDSIRESFGQVNDIHLHYVMLSLDYKPHIFNPMTEEWIPTEPGNGGWVMGPIEMHISEFISIGLEEFLDAGNGTIRLGGDHFFGATAQLVRYHPDYRCIKLLHRTALTRVGGLAFHDGRIWVAVLYHSISPLIIADSVLVFDSTGTRVHTFDPGLGHICGLTSHRGHMWALAYPPYTLKQLDADWEVLDSVWVFRWWDPFGMYRGFAPAYDMTSALGYLWVGWGSSLAGYLTDSSLAIGEAVNPWQFPLLHFEGYGSVAWDGAYFYACGPEGLGRFNLSSWRVDNFPLYVEPETYLAWDGEAIWMTHYGPKQTFPNTIYLSRFRLPEYPTPEGGE